MYKINLYTQIKRLPTHGSLKNYKLCFKAMLLFRMHCYNTALIALNFFPISFNAADNVLNSLGVKVASLPFTLLPLRALIKPRRGFTEVFTGNV